MRSIRDHLLHKRGTISGSALLHNLDVVLASIPVAVVEGFNLPTTAIRLLERVEEVYSLHLARATLERLNISKIKKSLTIECSNSGAATNPMQWNRNLGNRNGIEFVYLLPNLVKWDRAANTQLFNPR
ncbi:hypothetical protein EVAR_22491_1 [Eumeta japonica]|uniref:Uncharacterized protein n=1 Tax=Eumeta variegata TaxID=151549 RepID=A0A4C1VCL3_EUMVA|nr:hypothetical protein EVAR_22491_1 [Eumeta japonica]